ncbi:mCG145418, partial [Mus musculus]
EQHNLSGGKKKERQRKKKKPILTKKKKKKKKYENHPGKNAQFYLVGNLHGAGGSVPLPRNLKSVK